VADLHRLAVATAMTALDITIVSVALPTIRGDLGLDQLQLQWVVNAYLLVVAAGLGIAGRLADMLDRTWILRIGIVVFVGASLLAGLAQDPAWLIFARALQGAGYALLIPVSLALLLGAFGPDSSGRAMGLYYATVLAFTVLGPLIGGCSSRSSGGRSSS
jgi:MFS family permease